MFYILSLDENHQLAKIHKILFLIDGGGIDLMGLR